MNLKSITPDDRKIFKRFLGQNPEPSVEYSFPWLHTWSENYFNGYTVWRDWLLISTNDGWFMPYGSLDCRDAVLQCKAWHDAENPDEPFAMCHLTERSRELLQEWFGKNITFEKWENFADYLYRTEDLAELRGRKYHAKRNFINRFIAAYGSNYSHEPITPQNIDEVWAFENRWVRRKRGNGDIDYKKWLNRETAAVHSLLNNIESLDVKSRLLRVGDKVIAFTIGATCGNNAVDVLCEKADYDYVGAYPMLNKLFAKHDCKGVEFINREDDLGIEGLRKAKLSYHPIAILDKYGATWND